MERSICGNGCGENIASQFPGFSVQGDSPAADNLTRYFLLRYYLCNWNISQSFSISNHFLLTKNSIRPENHCPDPMESFSMETAIPPMPLYANRTRYYLSCTIFCLLYRESGSFGDAKAPAIKKSPQANLPAGFLIHL